MMNGHVVPGIFKLNIPLPRLRGGSLFIYRALSKVSFSIFLLGGTYLKPTNGLLINIPKTIFSFNYIHIVYKIGASFNLCYT